MSELIVARKGELEGDAKSLDGHDRDGADRRTDRQVNDRVLLAVDGSDLVDHNDCEDDDRKGIQKKT